MSSPARRPLPGRPAPAAGTSAGAPTDTATRGRTRPGQNRPSRNRGGPGTVRRVLDPTSWRGAIILMSALTAAVWVVQVVNAHDDYALNRFGLRPRTVSGLWGVLCAPFLHGGYDQLLSNTAPLVIIGWVVMLGGWRVWFTVTAIAVVGGGLLTWLVGPGDTTIVGASGLVFGWLGYLVARAVLTRRIRWIVSTALVIIFFGTLLNGLIPVPHSHVSWQAHVCGLAAGVAAGAVLHPRDTRRRSRRRAVS